MKQMRFVALERGVAPSLFLGLNYQRPPTRRTRYFAGNHCHEITSSEFVKLALPPLVPIAWSLPYDQAITPMLSA
jgi:hypothetical protein